MRERPDLERPAGPSSPPREVPPQSQLTPALTAALIVYSAAGFFFLFWSARKDAGLGFIHEVPVLWAIVGVVLALSIVAAIVTLVRGRSGGANAGSFMASVLWLPTIAIALVATFVPFVYELGRPDSSGGRTAAQQQAIEQVPELRQGLQTTPTEFASLWPESVALSEKVEAGARGAKLASEAQALAAAYEPVATGFEAIATRLAALEVGQELVTQMTDLRRASALAGESASAYAVGIAAKDETKIAEGNARMDEATKLLVVIGERVPKLAQQYGVQVGEAGSAEQPSAPVSPK